MVNPPYPLTIAIPTPTERISISYHQDPLQKLESCGQEEPVTTEGRMNQDFVQSLPPLPPYTSLPGNLHHRALLRAASIYAYHDLAANSTLPMYFPQI